MISIKGERKRKKKKQSPKSQKKHIFYQPNWTSPHYVTTLALGMQHKGHKDRNLPIKNKVYFNIKRKKKGL